MRGFLGLVGLLSVYFYAQRPEPVVLPEYRSYFMEPSFVDGAFAAVTAVQRQPDASMVLVNHHLLSSQSIARALATVATDDPMTVVLVSPDHFTGGIAPATSVVANWLTPYGMLEPADSAIATLASAGVVHLMERPFVREHGITNITMFIKKALPNARLVPVVMRDDAPPTAVEALAQAVHALPGHVLVVGSFDFTHDATDAVARANDALSLGILERNDIESAGSVTVDSRPGIEMMMRLAQLRGLRFSVLEMTNSARILSDLSRTDVTSYITGVWVP